MFTNSYNLRSNLSEKNTDQRNRLINFNILLPVKSHFHESCHVNTVIIMIVNLNFDIYSTIFEILSVHIYFFYIIVIFFINHFFHFIQTYFY